MKRWDGLRRRARQYMTEEEAQLASRYRDLYGDGTYEEQMAAHRKSRQRQVILALAGFLLLFGYAIYQEFAGMPGAVYEDDRLVAIERPQNGKEAVSFDARVYALTPQGTVTEDRAVFIGAAGGRESADRAVSQESYEDMVRRRIDQAARDLDRDRQEATVYLPQELDDGVQLIWTERANSMLPLLIVLFVMTAYYLYRSRFQEIERQEKQARESVIRELPEFLHRLVLLLGAGVVLEAAFRRAMEDIRGDTYFAQQMQYIRERAERTNAPLQEEFRAFAQRSGVREMTRLAGILQDNVERGTDLSVKLREESELLWFERKKQSEEKGRLAETKLTLPLVILLCVLVLVTVSPALFEM